MAGTAALVDLMMHLAVLDDREQIIARFTEQVDGLLTAERVSVALPLADDPDHLVVLAASGATDRLAPGARLPVEGSMVGRVLERGDAVEWATEGRPEHDAIALQALGVAHVISAPIAIGHELHGSLNAGWSVERPERSERELVELLARLLASQLDRVAYLERVEAEVATREIRADRLMVLHGLESRLSRASSIDDVLDVLASSIFDLVPARRVSYAGVGPERGQATIYAIRGAGDVGDPTVIPVDDASFAETWADNTLLYNRDHRRSDLDVHAELMEMGVLSSLNLGVFVDGAPIGTLNIGCADVDALTAEDRALLTTLGSFMGSTLERIAAHDRLVYQAHHDVLTGLLRREQFEAVLTDEIERLARLGGRSAVCFVDLDRFKLINDTEGHQVGDQLLQAVAERLRSTVEAGDVVARLGGDEFVVLVRNQPADELASVCDQLVASIAATPIVTSKSVISASASAGWSLIDGRTRSAHDAIADADAACYVAKNRAGSRYAVQASERDEAQAERRSVGHLLNDVRGAIERDQLVLHGQPITPLRPGGPSGVEVLVRMYDENGALIPPARFIPAAERYGLIADLDLWVCRAALRALRAGERTAATGPDLLYLNVSANSISDPSFAERVMACVHDAEIDPARLCFEVTESGTMRHLDAVIDFIATMHRLGASVALDDFGAGFSSLGALRHLPVDHLKIDGSLVRDIDVDPVSAAMVASVQALADALGLTTVAEHIESQSVLDAVNATGIDAGQGYFLGRPGPLEDLLGLRESHTRSSTPGAR